MYTAIFLYLESIDAKNKMDDIQIFKGMLSLGMDILISCHKDKWY